MSNKGTLILLAVGVAAAGYGLYRKLVPAGGMPQVVMATGQQVDGSQVAGPVRANLLATPRGREIVFTILLADAEGRQIRAINLAGRRPEPKVSVVDDTGKIVHEGRFSYG